MSFLHAHGTEMLPNLSILEAGRSEFRTIIPISAIPPILTYGLYNSIIVAYEKRMEPGGHRD
jgi:hypothetical protein